MFTLAAVTLAALAHTLGHGMPPQLPVLLVAGAVVLAAAQLAAGRERSFAGIAGAMVVVQVALHLALMLSWTSTSGTAALSLGPGRTVVVLPAALCLHRSTSPALGALGQSGGGSWWPMICAHALAALLLAWVLRCGEAAGWALARTARRAAQFAVRRLLTRQPGGSAQLPARSRQRPWGARPVRPLRGRLLRDCLVLRGPPALTA